MALPASDRFWSKVAKSGDTGCWVFTAGKYSSGYGQFWANGRNHYAHRFSYTLLVGEVPSGLELDHLCRNRACVNPAHLEPVTHAVNILRSPIAACGVNAAKTHCAHGHEFTEDNIYVGTTGGRRCRTCRREQKIARRAALDGTSCL